jgi:hypothetical protein
MYWQKLRSLSLLDFCGVYTLWTDFHGGKSMLDWLSKVFLESEYFGPTFRSFERTVGIALSVFQCFGTLIAGSEFIAIQKRQITLTRQTQQEVDKRAIEWYNREINPKVIKCIRNFMVTIENNGGVSHGEDFNASIGFAINGSGLNEVFRSYFGSQQIMDPNGVTLELLLGSVSQLNTRVLENGEVTGVVKEIFGRCLEEMR